ncbi:MAG TPA: helix-turn-helix domain-containing protein [Thermoplasmata archaeon]|jgi:predicted DNA binding protein
MRLAVLAVNIPGNWIKTLSTSCDLSVRVFKCVPRNGGGGQGFLQIDTAADMSGEDLASRIKTHDPRCSVQLISAGPGRYVGTVELDTCQVCRLVADSGCFLDSATSRPDGLVQWNVISPNAAGLKTLVDRVRELGCSATVERVSKLRTAQELTREQERVLQLAYELGYYEIPRKIKLEKLAKRLEISKATLDVMLRRAQRKVIARHLGNMA